MMMGFGIKRRFGGEGAKGRERVKGFKSVNVRGFA